MDEQYKNSKPRVISLYLPQFHPIPENDEWWGKGFTEWTNVGRARPLFKGHYQPKVPGDLGYYDLRVPETRIAQAELAKEAGIEGFCYWHYWFGNGKRLLERPFNEVLSSGKPEFPFCLGWANHTWKAKTWSPDGVDKPLIEQKYGGIVDYTHHFNDVLPAFKDKRYILVNNKPVFLVWDPNDLPNPHEFINLWQELARKNGFEGIYFIASALNIERIDKFKKMGFDAVSIDLLVKAFHDRRIMRKVWFRFKRAILKTPKFIKYEEYTEYFKKNFPVKNYTIPTIIPNFDHSPRSGKYAQVIIGNTPSKFKEFLLDVFKKVTVKDPEENIVILRSWNEWAEGNYLEPDLKYGKGYLDSLKQALNNY